MLAQFPGKQVPVITLGNVRQWEQIAQVVQQAQETHGLIVHTLVDSPLRVKLVELARASGVPAIDLVGELLVWLAETLGQKPAEQPGLYRNLRQDYFDRIGAIEFTMAHDDGKNSEGLDQAELIIAGVSRVGKTPLSIYLSILGWKVANVPIILGVEPPPELFRLEPRRVIGLTIEPGQLILHRQQRQSRMGTHGPSAYTDPQAVYDELEFARGLFKRNGFAIIDVTDKPIETSADEIIRLIARQAQSTIIRKGQGD
jgi:regulator of PEP synthase PpsR (kinase-PPPase family)